MTDGKKSLSQPVELREILHYGISLVRAARRSLKAYGKNLQHIKALYTRALLITAETSDKQPPRGGESGGGSSGATGGGGRAGEGRRGGNDQQCDFISCLLAPCLLSFTENRRRGL